MPIKDILNNYNSEHNVPRGSTIEDALQATLSSVNQTVIDAGDELPDVTPSDEGKVLKVNNAGQWVIGDDESLPAVTSSDEGKALVVDENGEWVAGEVASGGNELRVQFTKVGSTITADKTVAEIVDAFNEKVPIYGVYNNHFYYVTVVSGTAPEASSSAAVFQRNVSFDSQAPCTAIIYSTITMYSSGVIREDNYTANTYSNHDPNNGLAGYINFNADPDEGFGPIYSFTGDFTILDTGSNENGGDDLACPITWPYSNALNFEEFKCAFTGYNTPLTLTVPDGDFFDAVGSIKALVNDMVTSATFDIVISNKKEELSSNLNDYYNLITSTKRVYQGAYGAAKYYPNYWNLRDKYNNHFFRINRNFASTVDTYIEDTTANKFITSVSFILSYGCMIGQSRSDLTFSLTLTDSRYSDGTQVPFANLMSSINVYLMFHGLANYPGEPYQPFSY